MTTRHKNSVASMGTTDDSLVYDYIIVGAGTSAMGLLYGLLVLKPDDKDGPPPSIAIVERGSSSTSTRSPASWCHASHHENSSLRLFESSTHLTRRLFTTPVGQGRGGTTNIHACLCTPPCREDFESWPDSSKEMLLESVSTIQDVMYANGALQLNNSTTVRLEKEESESSTLDDSLWRETTFPSVVHGIPTSTSVNDKGDSIRMNYYEALVKPLLMSSHPITWIMGAEAQRLIFAKNNDEHGTQVVRGIEFIRTAKHTNKQDRQVLETNIIFARRDVILCAGAIETPALLLTSGIGHYGDLQRMEIEPRVPGSVAGVGRQLVDHVLVPRVMLKSPTEQRTNRVQPSPSGVSGLAYFRVEKSRYQVMLNDAGVYAQVVPQMTASLFRYRFQKKSTRSFWSILVPVLNAMSVIVSAGVRVSLRLLFKVAPLRFILSRCTLCMNLVLLSPASSGSVAVRRKRGRSDPSTLQRRDVDVVVDVGYLNDERDIEALWKGWRFFSNSLTPILSPMCLELPLGFLKKRDYGNQSDCPAWFRYFCRGTCVPYFHYCGTCAMETQCNEEWVVDSSLRVRDMLGLRVCDASVFPTTLSGPTALTCAGIGYSLAGMLTKDTGKKQR